MDRKPHRVISRSPLVLAVLALVACGQGITEGSGPRLLVIPPQTAGSGVVSLDLSGFVDDPDAATMTYSVLSGGGGFAGSTYQNSFASLGTYTVAFEVGVGEAKSEGEFDVVVTDANFAVVHVDGTYHRLLDTDTELFLEVSASFHPETFRVGLPGGALVFERAVGSNTDLYVYDPIERRTMTLGAATDQDELFRLVTAGGQVVFSTGTISDPDLRIWNPATRFVSDLSTYTGELDQNPHAADDGLVFYERVAAGNGDIYYYDPSLAISVAVSIDAADEDLFGTVAGGGAVFGRPGTTAEVDLYYYSRTYGLLEVGGDLAAIDSLDKSFDGGTSDGRVVFSATDTLAVPTTTNICVWNPADDTTVVASTTTLAEVNTFAGVTPGDVVVFVATDTASPGTDDVLGYSVPDDTVEVASSGNADHTVEAVGAIGGDDFVVYSIAAAGSVHVYNFEDDAREDFATATHQFDDVLSDGRVVVSQLTGGGGLVLYDADLDATTVVLSGAVPIYRGPGAEAGDVVFERDVGGQNDLFLWDDSAGGVVVVSADAAPDRFQAVSPDGKVVFSRVLTGNTTEDLFVFDPGDASTEQLTFVDGIGEAHDHAVVGSYSATTN